MNESEKKFVVNPEGEAGETKTSGEEKSGVSEKIGFKKKRKLLTLKEDRMFIADDKGNVEQVGSGELKPHFRDTGKVVVEKEKNQNDVGNDKDNEKEFGSSVGEKKNENEGDHVSKLKDMLRKAFEGTEFKVIDEEEEKKK